MYFAAEDIGAGYHEIPINFKSPADFGFDMEVYNNSYVGTKGTTISSVANGGMIRLCHYIRPALDGSNAVEVFSRFWIAKEANVSPEALKGLNYHGLEEFTQLGAVLPTLYRDYAKDTI
ncbi:hypothetical protein CKF54_04165 [Psittacicella hinzii]|uniref:DAPG hydrolase PhiG domain-containing protein n=2 Tax=Psittacicella hinzii TaxID=2028575 RepID=A0A3A1Y6I7_9GAMM|nr:hypothetical protein CKF54_04165 [Psittacicella hinzii]